MIYKYDSWLSKITDRKCYKVAIDNLEPPNLRLGFLYSKIPLNDITAYNFLIDNGFELADTNIVFTKPINNRNYSNVRFAIRPDAEEVEQLAGKEFEYSRFHMDSKFSKDTANFIKQKWARNYFMGKRGNQMVVALHNDVVVGFLLLIYETKTLIIDLIAVGSQFRHRGLACSMIAYAESNNLKFDEIQVGTQLINGPSIHFYTSLGFRASSVQYILHCHNY